MKRRAVQLGALSVMLGLTAAALWQTRALWSGQKKDSAAQATPEEDGDSEHTAPPTAPAHEEPVPLQPSQLGGRRDALLARKPAASLPPEGVLQPQDLANQPAVTADERRSALPVSALAHEQARGLSTEAAMPPNAEVLQGLDDPPSMFPSPAALGLAAADPATDRPEDESLLARGQSPGDQDADANPLRAVSGGEDSRAQNAEAGVETIPLAGATLPPPPAPLDAGSDARPLAGEGSSPSSGLRQAPPNWNQQRAPRAENAATVPTQRPFQRTSQPTPARQVFASGTPQTPGGGVAQPTQIAGEFPGGARMTNPPPSTAGRFAAGGDALPSGVEGMTTFGASASALGRPGDQALEGPQEAQLRLEKLAPAEIQVGKEATFELRVQNVGRTQAKGIQIVDQVPQGTQLRGTTPRADQMTAEQIVWQIDALAPGEERVLQIHLMPQREGDIGSVATVQFAARASVRTRCTRPELQLNVTAPAKVMVGEEQVVSIEIHNPGTGDATGVMLLENVPEGMRHAHGPSLEFEVGTLRAGETRELELVLTAEQAGIVENRMIARGDANLQTEGACRFEVIAPELQVVVAGPQRRYLERPATYTLQLQNPGTAAARDVELVSHLPKGMKFVRADNYGEYDEATHSVYWSLAELPASQAANVELVMLPTEAGEKTIRVESKADRGLAHRAEQSVLVEGLAAIKIEVVDLQDPIEVGTDTTYEIVVENQGSKAATNVRVVAALPQGMRLVSAEGPTDYRGGRGGVEFAPLTRLAPKADTTYRIVVQGDSAGDQRFRVHIVTDELQQPITEEESTRVYADQ